MSALDGALAGGEVDPSRIAARSLRQVEGPGRAPWLRGAFGVAVPRRAPVSAGASREPDRAASARMDHGLVHDREEG